MDQLQFDLSIVKKESQYFEDYGQNGGHLLDNIIPESDFDQFGQGANVVSIVLLIFFCLCPSFSESISTRNYFHSYASIEYKSLFPQALFLLKYYRFFQCFYCLLHPL